jgi:hypothetical protein
MYLRDIVLSVENRLSSEDVWKRARNGDRAVLEMFQRATFCVSDLFVTLLGRKVKTADTEKIVIILDDVIVCLDAKSIVQVGSVMFMKWPLSLGGFESKNNDEKKLYILEILYMAVSWVARIKGWPQEPIDGAYQLAREKGVVHTGYLLKGKVVYNPLKSIGVRLLYDFDIDKMRIIAVFVDPKGVELRRRIIVDEKPTDCPLPHFEGTIRWVSNKRFMLRSRGKSESWVCDVE